jgi:hypothetical protein
VAGADAQGAPKLIPATLVTAVSDEAHKPAVLLDEGADAPHVFWYLAGR